jgi:hypothetical protein
MKPDFPLSRAIEFAEENPLPRPQKELSVCKNKLNRVPNKRGFDMSRSVPFGMGPGTLF